jgi:outer membrane protein assembly factor BamC
MMTRFTRSRWILVLGAAVVSGCSWTGSLFGSSKPAYEGAQQAQAPLEVPPDLSQLPRDERFVVPERPQTITASGQQAARAGAGAAPSAAASAAVVPPGVVAKIERQGQQRWLSVNLPPERVWPILIDFWPTVGMQIEKSDPKTGVMETKWAETRTNVPQGVIRRALGAIFQDM